MSGEAEAREDARTIRGRGILLIGLGLWGGAIVFTRALVGTDWQVWLLLGVGIAAVPYAWLAFGIPLTNPGPGPRTRADRVQVIASAVCFVAFTASNLVMHDMAGVLWFWGLAAAVSAAPFLVAGIWALREASRAPTASRSDERPVD